MRIITEAALMSTLALSWVGLSLGADERLAARRSEPPMRRWWMAWCLGLLLCTVTAGYADDRQGSPFDNEHWEGYRTWKPDRRRGLTMPDQFTIDKRGKCEVICQRIGREYKCKEYRC